MLNAVTTDIDSVDEAARPFYIEKDGKFFLQVTPAEGLALEDVTGLKTALAAERRAHGDAEAQRLEALARLDEFQGIDPVAARAALAAGASPDVEAAVAARVDALRSGIAEAAGREANAAKAETEATRTKLSSREKQLTTLLRDAAIRSEMDRLHPLPETADLLLMVAGRSVVMVEGEGGEMVPTVVGQNGDPRLDAQGKPFSIRSLAKEIQDARPSLFAPTKVITGLGGAPHERGASSGGPALGPNPFAKPTWNLTQQVVLQQRNPALAARFRAEAGA